MPRKNLTSKRQNFVSRRTFLKAVSGAAVGFVAAACQPATELSSPISTPHVAELAPSPSPRPNPLATVAVVEAANYDRALIRQQVQAALDALGGLGDVIKPGASVAVKVNLTGGVSSKSTYGVSRQESYWTHPEVARALGELLVDAGAKTLYFVEAVYDPQSYPEGGFTEVAKDLGATLINLNVPAPYADFYTASVGKDWFIYQSFPFNRVLDNIDAFISVPKLKCHYNCGVTVSMKNLIGIAPLSRFQVQASDSYRHAFHNGPDGTQDFKARLPRVVLDLNRARPIHFSLVDAVSTIDAGEGPWITDSRLQTPHVLIAGKSPLATDAVSTAIMGFEPTADYPDTPFVRGDNHLNLARGLGLGTNRLEEIEVKGVAIETVRQQFGISHA